MEEEKIEIVNIRKGYLKNNPYTKLFKKKITHYVIYLENQIVKKNEELEDLKAKRTCFRVTLSIIAILIILLIIK